MTKLQDDFAGIESRPGVSGGEACIVRTRIPVWVLVQARNLGTCWQDWQSSLLEVESQQIHVVEIDDSHHHR